MGDETLFDTLRRFHAEVLRPEFAEVRADLSSEVGQLRRETLEHFDQIYGRFARLESEYQSISAAIARLEERPSGPSELHVAIQDLRARLRELETRLSELESHS